MYTVTPGKSYNHSAAKKSSLKHGVGRYLAIAVFSMATASSVMADGEMSAEQKAKMEKVQQLMKAEMQLMQPDLQKQVAALSPQTKQAIARIYSQHSRRSQTLTLRQVMHEVQSDYQSTATGILTDNNEQAADSARRLANHRLPKGGLLPYLKAEHINDEMLGVLVPFNDSVEGNALRLAEAADKGDIALAAEYFGKITSGCVACHQVFRGQPGISPRLR
jgi:excinuclease UvrABC ATPase subunit